MEEPSISYEPYPNFTTVRTSGMVWCIAKDNYKLHPDHIVIESSKGRLILCNRVSLKINEKIIEKYLPVTMLPVYSEDSQD